jgi:pimeloyl-ACP methyl ester carboxylesterase
MPRLTVGTSGRDDVELAYEDVGAGRPVVLIHGWPLSGRSWEAQVAPLVEAGYRVVTYDRRGFGDSSRPYDGYDYDTLAADLAALLDHLDLTDVTLVGFSMGGGEVARYLGTHGESRIHSAVLAAAVTPALGAAQGGALDDATVQSFLDGIRGDRPAFLQGFVEDFFTAEGEQTVSEATRHFAWQAASTASPKGTADCVAAFATTDFREDLKKVTVPLLVLHGSADGVVPFDASGRRVPELVPHAQTVVVAGGPHGVNASHAEQFNAALLDFLG